MSSGAAGGLSCRKESSLPGSWGRCQDRSPDPAAKAAALLSCVRCWPQAARPWAETENTLSCTPRRSPSVLRFWGLGPGAGQRQRVSEGTLRDCQPGWDLTTEDKGSTAWSVPRTPEGAVPSPACGTCQTRLWPRVKRPWNYWKYLAVRTPPRDDAASQRGRESRRPPSRRTRDRFNSQTQGTQAAGLHLGGLAHLPPSEYLFGVGDVADTVLSPHCASFPARPPQGS